ncbi:MAG: RagB/SusD family nutrient uptake outer membrane protein [Bacteroidales bacterium]|nr:RagB/SusD family nutrient uptake outer membrane protein [Bacteroidales bacterium]
MIRKTVTKLLSGIGAVVMAGAAPSCNYLDVVPDNIPIIEHAFSDRNHAEAYLYGCYSFLPVFSNPLVYPGFFGGDEVWLFDGVSTSELNTRMWRIAKGEQNTSMPIANYWASKNDTYNIDGGIAIFTAISDLNIFLNMIDLPGDLPVDEKRRWIAEAQFLKAYFHFWLLRCYGPIPIIDKNLSINAGQEEVQVYRQPVEDVVDYIVETLENAMLDLPYNVNFGMDMGRPDKAIAAAVKAQTLVLAASPLFNGNPYYVDNNLTDKRGIPLFPTHTEPDVSKWERAADAIREAIQYADSAGHQIYDAAQSELVSDELPQQIRDASQVRIAATDHWNPEIVWGQLPRSNPDMIQRISYPPFTEANKTSNLLMCNAPPLHIVEQFYSKNGVPIDEDKDFNGFADRYDLRQQVASDTMHQYYIANNAQTLRLHFDREPRFYGAITFDGSLYFGNGSDRLTVAVLKSQSVSFRYSSLGGLIHDRHSSTGYLARKMLHPRTAIEPASTAPIYTRYAFPIIRLGDLYLLYAEALNEAYGATGDADGVTDTTSPYTWLNRIRTRAGIPTVKTAWDNHAIHPDTYTTQDGLRNIIRQERLNELAFEGVRFWDLRRWKWSEKYLNETIRGLNIYGDTDDEFYRVTELHRLSFEQKDYLWPLRYENLLKNQNISQNPGW